MRLILATVAAAVLSTAALAQGTATPGSADSGAPGTANPAVTVKPKAAPESTGSVEAGANSFTEAQARSRFEAQGLLDVKDLRKDDQGIWRGTAMRNGQSVGVALDFKGTVAAQ
ncbi:MAG: PepSY domain-containing protein [Microvirga sp.]